MEQDADTKKEALGGGEGKAYDTIERDFQEARRGGGGRRRGAGAPTLQVVLVSPPHRKQHFAHLPLERAAHLTLPGAGSGAARRRRRARLLPRRV